MVLWKKQYMSMEVPMDNRAKQFVPFAAVKGYEEALRAKEKIVVEKIELSEEKKAELDFKLHQIKRNDIITVVYFYKDEYIKLEGMVSRLDVDARVLKVVNTKIPYEDIYELSGANIVEE
ncbi:MAG: YolD-like family protein [Agathobacter sp.]|nr:YolD-like family protein [Agathobacter sp.]